jgi:aminopeptidase-like protein
MVACMWEMPVSVNWSESQKFLGELLRELFPLYRALCGPDFRHSLDTISKYLPLDVTSVPSGTRVNGWTVPKEFIVKEAWVADMSGRKVIDFAEHPYHLKIYSQPFDGTVDRSTLLSKIAVCDSLPEAIPLRQCYYVNDWGFCATHSQLARLTDAEYRVHIDVEHRAGNVDIGECYLPGTTEHEIVFTAYLCHPRGANDNLSGVTVAVELMRLLSKLPRRKFGYRLLLNPETIGTVAWIHREGRSERLSRIVGGYEISICGDSSPVRYFASHLGDDLIDKAGLYALARSGLAAKLVGHSYINSGSDQTQFSAPGLRIPFGRWARAGAGNYAAYHSSADNLELVTSDNLLETLRVVWHCVMALERNIVLAPRYVGLPFLSGLGVYPYKHFKGDGSANHSDVASAYYELLGWVDGKSDMISIAKKTGLPIEAFDEAIEDFERVGLVHAVE